MFTQSRYQFWVESDKWRTARGTPKGYPCTGCRLRSSNVTGSVTVFLFEYVTWFEKLEISQVPPWQVTRQGWATYHCSRTPWPQWNKLNLSAVNSCIPYFMGMCKTFCTLMTWETHRRHHLVGLHYGLPSWAIFAWWTQLEEICSKWWQTIA
jgi:hypothetical protein